MPKIAPIYWRKFCHFVEYVGCTFVRQKGDHHIYWRDGFTRPIVIPEDADLPVYVIKNNLRILGMTNQEYIETLKRI